MHTIQRFGMYILLMSAAALAHAHKPVAVGALESSAEAPIALFDINVSQVLYYEPSAARPEIWMRFHGEAEQELYVQPGVPRIDGLEGVRPAFAVLAPGLPAIELPFDVPEGYGGLVYTSDDSEPEPFDEPFTGTQDWQFPAQHISLPQTGDYLLVAYLPGGGLDKFWIAVGEDEQFTLADIVNLPKITIQVRQFHEIFPIGGIALIGPLIAFLLALFTLLAKAQVR